MKIATRHWILSAGLLCAMGLAGCHKSSSTVGQTTTTPPGSVPWTWAAGSDVSGRSGVYGTVGVPASINAPGGRDGSASWTDAAGNLWLFGGLGYDVSGTAGSLNDLWQYSPTTKLWTWVSGGTTNLANRAGSYGTLGTPAAGNVPGARAAAAAWTDAAGNFWLFGGIGYDINGLQGDLNDLWEFDPTTQLWTWVGGSSTANAGGLYTAPAGQVPWPGARESAVAVTDAAGNFWLYAGGGYDGSGQNGAGNNGLLSDLWKYTPSTGRWTWVAGNRLANAPASYGTLGTAAASNVPGSRQASAGWADKNGKLYFFGGNGFDANDLNGYLSDLWSFNPTTVQWTWVGGSNVANVGGTYGTQASPATTNNPGGRAGAATYADSAGNLWLFGGQGYDASADQGYLNDLWEYQPATGTWQYLAGATQINALAQYGTLGTGSVNQSPSARYGVANWTDKSNHLWLFGGGGYDVNAILGDLNDLWQVTITP